MSKNYQQVRNFLVGRAFKSQITYEMIAAFCSQHLNLTLNTPRTFDKTDGIDTETFLEWYANGFAQGDIIKWGDKLAVLGNSSPSAACICCYLESDGTIVKDVSIKISISDIKHTTEDERLTMSRQLLKEGLEIDLQYLTISKKRMPRSGEQVKFSDGITTGYGVLRNIEKDGTVVMYCYFTTAGKLDYSMHGKLGRVEFLQFEPMTIGYRRRLEKELNKHGKSWNEKRCRIEPTNYKLKLGKFYWYVTDLLRVVRAVDNGKATANLRYLSGNYFHSLKEAVECQTAWSETLRDKLAADENETDE